MQGRRAGIDLTNVLKTSSPKWDGGYVICGLTGSGECFAVRDPWGIRPGFWYMDDEIMVLASERPVIQTVLNVPADSVNELQPGQAILVNKKGEMRLAQSRKRRKPVRLSGFTLAAEAMWIFTASGNYWARS